ncbi:MAG: NUDIX hydrolase [bacterium]
MTFIDFNDLGGVVEALAHHEPGLITQDGIKRASVALILSAFGGETQVLFIQRATSKKDPWSGQIAFPGGGEEDLDLSLEQTAIRESLEEVGVPLKQHMIIGRLDDLQGSSRNRSLNLAISCFVFRIEQEISLVPNYEVADVFWTPLGVLQNPVNRFAYHTEYRTEPFPAIRLGQGSSGQQRVLWGLTYRFIQCFFDVLEIES